MKIKNKIGALAVLGGIALLGYAYFKKNKPNVASTQLKGLKDLSTYYNTSYGGQEETYIKGTNYVIPKVEGINLVNLSLKDNQDITNRIGEVYNSNWVSDQISENMKNVDFSRLSELGLANIDFSKIKI